MVEQPSGPMLVVMVALGWVRLRLRRALVVAFGERGRPPDVDADAVAREEVDVLVVLEAKLSIFGVAKAGQRVTYATDVIDGDGSVIEELVETVSLRLDGVAANDKGRFELEVIIARGGCG